MAGNETAILIPNRIVDMAGDYLEHDIAMDIIEMELGSWLDNNGIEMTVGEFAWCIARLIAEGDTPRI